MNTGNKYYNHILNNRGRNKTDNIYNNIKEERRYSSRMSLSSNAKSIESIFKIFEERMSAVFEYTLEDD